MLKRTIFVAVVLIGVGAAAWVISPALRTEMQQGWNDQTGWTEEARRADPVGFLIYAESKLSDDLESMQSTRRELAGEVGELVKHMREQAALAEHARELAEEFRAAYQTALADESFPVEVRGEAYTEAQIRTQVSLLLAQAEGYEQSLEDVQDVMAEAEAKMQELAVRIDATRSQLAALATKRELMKARQLTSEGEQLLANVDELMTGNTQAIAGTPIRTTPELVAAVEAKPAAPATDRLVEEFLASVPVATEPEEHEANDVEQEIVAAVEAAGDEPAAVSDAEIIRFDAESSADSDADAEDSLTTDDQEVIEAAVEITPASLKTRGDETPKANEKQDVQQKDKQKRREKKEKKESSPIFKQS